MNAQPNALVIEHTADQPREVTPLTLLRDAVNRGADPATLREFMEMARDYRRDLAKMAFDAALAEAKAGIKIVEKNATGHNNKRYANFAAYAKAIDPVLSQHGLSYRFRSTQDDRIHVTCILSHREGHSEENSLAGPADTTGSKNAIQAIGSTLTYLQRYTLVQALGLAAGEDDDGRAAGNGGTISEAQLTEIETFINEHNAEPSKILTRCGVESLDQIPAKDFDGLMVALRAWAGNKGSKS